MNKEFIKKFLEYYRNNDYENGLSLINDRYNQLISSQEEATILNCGEVIKCDKFLGPNEGIKAGVWTPYLSIDDFNIPFLKFSDYLSRWSIENISLQEIANAINIALLDYYGTSDTLKLQALYTEYCSFKSDNHNKKFISMKEFYKKNVAACVERSALAHNLMKFIGMDSNLILGKVKENNYIVGHVFTVVKYNEQAYFLDFSNPTLIQRNGKNVAGEIDLIKISEEQYSSLVDECGNVTVTHKIIINDGIVVKEETLTYARARDNLGKSTDKHK